MRRISFPLLPALLVIACAASAAAPKTKEPVDPNKVRCKSELETGSLVKRNRICRTEAEWRDLAVTGRKVTQDMQTSVGGQQPQ